MKHIFLNTDLSKTFLPEENAIRIFDKSLSKSFILHYLSLYALLEDSTVNVPKILKFFQAYEGGWGILQENIKGVSLEDVANAEPEQYEEFLETLIDLQLKVNTLTLPGLGALNDKLRIQIGDLKLETSKKEELWAQLDKMPKGISLINGKLTLSNIIDTSNEEEPYIIDWSEMTLGVPEAEAANTYLLLSCNSTEMAEQYLTLYSTRTKTDKKKIREWLPLMGAGQLSLGVISELHSELILPWLDL